MLVEMSPSQIDEQKRALRKRMRAMRLVADQKEGPDAALAVARVVMARMDDLRLAEGSCVAGYWPISTELDVRPLLARLERAGLPCALPVIEEGRDVLVFRRWRPGEDLQPGIFETRQPPSDAPLVLPDVVLVPLLAVDAAGRRLGHGRGWYDRTLAALRRGGDGRGPVAVGVCFSSQVIDNVPRDDRDEPVDWILTGDRLVRCQTLPSP
jgi:5-formyltetrahydrofolate cyclo-ligase